MRGKRILIAFVAPVLLVASATSARSTPVGRVAQQRISPPPAPAPPVVRRTTQVALPPVSSDVGVAITFDDGPSPEFTPAILDILRSHKARATFFMVGDAAQRYPELVRRVVAEGHAVGNHTWNHTALPSLDEAGFVAQVDRTQTLLTQLGARPLTCIRPPFGKVGQQARRLAAARGLSILRWTSDTEDWKLPGVDLIVGRALGGAAPGGVILMHDSGPDMSQTVAALPAVLEGIAARRLSFAPAC